MKRCQGCGRALAEEVVLCPVCGALQDGSIPLPPLEATAPRRAEPSMLPPPPPMPGCPLPVSGVPSAASPLGLLAMIFGIASIVLLLLIPILSVILALTALVLGCIGRSRRDTNRVQVHVGLILGSVSLALLVVGSVGIFVVLDYLIRNAYAP